MSKSTNQHLILENLFGSKLRVKILKFLFRNYPNSFGIKDLTRRTQEQLEPIRKEIGKFAKIGLIKTVGKTSYVLNPDFEFFGELRGLILKSSPAEKDKMIRRILALGRIRLAVISGVFLNKDSTDIADSKVDLFIVGDDINKKKLGIFLRSLEAEVGKEIRFGLMEKEEFEYRYGMFDRFVRVLLESPHDKLINKLGL